MRNIYVGVILMSALAVWAADKVQPLNVKVGLWEVTTTTTTSGQMPIPAELLARLTPEQRARMEERMKANSAEKTRTITHKQCMTKEKLAKESAFGQDDRRCTRTVVSSSESKVELKMQCGVEGMKGEGTGVVEALNSESVKSSVHIVAIGGGHTMNSNSSSTAKWIGPVCGTVN